MGYKFLQSSKGNNSNSRLIGSVVVGVALIFVQEILIIGRENISGAAGAAGLLFVSVAGPALAFLFGQKYNEERFKKEE